VRFVFSPPAEEATGLLTFPWTEPLEDWKDERLVEIRQRGISRHVVRFASDNGVRMRSSPSASGSPGGSTGCCGPWPS
jgi:hypothetical protein